MLLVYGRYSFYFKNILVLNHNEIDQVIIPNHKKRNQQLN